MFKNFLPDIPAIQEPENRLAKALVIAFSLMVFGLLIFVIGFIFRELLLEIFVTQTPLDRLIARDDYIEMWKASLRFDAKFIFLAIVPALFFSLLGILGGKIFQYSCRLTTVYVAHIFGWYYLSNVANLHFITTQGYSLGSPQWELFKEHPFEILSTLWPNYPIVTDILLGIVIGGIFVALWFRLFSVLSRWSLWQGSNITNHLIALCCFFGFLWTCAQHPVTTSSPLKAKDAIVSQYPIMNTITVGAPMAIYMDESLRKLNFFTKP